MEMTPVPAPASAKPKTILVCTVGGSPGPIRSAIRHLEPEILRFLVTFDHPEASPPWKGSASEARTLAAELDLGPEGTRWELVEVVPDDVDRIYNTARSILRALREQYAKAKIVVDFTGGTKAMSAGLLNAALDDPEIEVQLMAGRRDDTNKTVPGSERPVRLRFDGLAARRALNQADALWSIHAYAAAARILEVALRALVQAGEAHAELVMTVERAWRASQCFAAWDRLDYAGAKLAYESGALRRIPALARFDHPLRKLADRERRLPLLLLDLWHNACRCAVREEYDDAVARCYRLVEATAQFLLRDRFKIDTSDLRLDRVLERIPAKERDAWTKRKMAGLLDAWRLFLWLAPADDPIKSRLEVDAVDGKPMGQLDEWIKARNYSLFAHGFEPVGRDGWEQVRRWLERYWLDGIWLRLGRPDELPQLPTSLSELTEAV